MWWCAQLYAVELVEPLLQCLTDLSRPDSLIAIAIYNRRCVTGAPVRLWHAQQRINELAWVTSLIGAD